MKHLIQTLITTVAVFILSLILQTTTSIINMKNGLVHVSEAITSHQKDTVNVDIVNYSHHMIDNLVLVVPNSLVLSEVAASYPMRIEKIPDSLGTNKQIRLKLSGINPHNTVSLSLPFATNNISGIMANVKDLNLDFESADNPDNPKIEMLKQGALVASITALFYVLFSLWFDQQHRKLMTSIADARKATNAEVMQAKEEVEKFKSELRTSDLKYDKLLAEGRDIKKDNTKLRIILQARLIDTSKELQFWRDTIRKLLYSEQTGKDKAEMLIQEITNTLKTYAAQERVPSFDSINMFAEILNKESNSTKDPSK